MPENPEKPVGELVHKTVDDTRKLVKKELALAKDELLEGAREAARSGALLAAGASLGLCGLGGLAISLGLALPTSPARGTLFVSLAMITGAGVCAVLGLAHLPKTFKNTTDGGAYTEAGY